MKNSVLFISSLTYNVIHTSNSYTCLLYPHQRISLAHAIDNVFNFGVHVVIASVSKWIFCILGILLSERTYQLVMHIYYTLIFCVDNHIIWKEGQVNFFLSKLCAIYLPYYALLNSLEFPALCWIRADSGYL